MNGTQILSRLTKTFRESHKVSSNEVIELTLLSAIRSGEVTTSITTPPKQFLFLYIDLPKCLNSVCWKPQK